MTSGSFPPYRHSGKFGVHGPILALVICAVLSFPLGFAYAYLMKWIPFVYINFIVTIGYAIVIGALCGVILKAGKVRNTPVAVLSGLLVGAIALYCQWNGHIYALFKDVSAFNGPGDLKAAMQYLYENGSWSLRRSGPVTGIFLGIVWVAEALAIVGGITWISLVMIKDTPFCEQNQCWLDDEKKIETLLPFSDPIEIAALKSGDLGPLTHAMRRSPADSGFARLTLKHSPRSQVFCTVRVENVTITTDKDGDTSEKVETLTGDLVLPADMFELIAKFEKFGAPETPAA